jgi:hypothetical protein
MQAAGMVKAKKTEKIPIQFRQKLISYTSTVYERVQCPKPFPWYLYGQTAPLVKKYMRMQMRRQGNRPQHIVRSGLKTSSIENSGTERRKWVIK